jgi:23S rRNA (adenine2503-C2)-methyltransferase
VERALAVEPTHPARGALHLRGLTPARLAGAWDDLHLDARVARRVTRRVVGEYRDDLEGVPGLSRRATTLLQERASLRRLRIVDRRASLVDPFVKYLFEADDGAQFESVRIPLEQPRFSVCVSSQAGCALGCRFCATGRAGFRRNLEAWEIVEQVLAIRGETSERPVTGVVLQGQGEPLLNYDNVLAAIDVLRDPCGAHIGSDRITLSTVGIPQMIERYTNDGHPYRLILSLTSAFDARRANLIPSAARYPVADLAQALRRHARTRGSLVHVAWVLIAGVNTAEDEAAELARLFPDTRVRVSLIDVNDPTGAYAPASDAERRTFMSALAARGIGFVRRYSGGADIFAACGMLASNQQGGRPLADERPTSNPALACHVDAQA